MFSKNHTYDAAYTPNKAVNTYDTKYYTDAWDGVNYDENPYTLFVYNGQTFVDPGFKNLKDMDGNTVSAEKCNSYNRSSNCQCSDKCNRYNDNNIANGHCGKYRGKLCYK